MGRYMGREGERATDRQTNRKGSRNSQQLNCSLHFLWHDSCRICINQRWPEIQNVRLDVTQGNDPISCQLKLRKNLELFCCATLKDTLFDIEKSRNRSLYKCFLSLSFMISSSLWRLTRYFILS